MKSINRRTALAGIASIPATVGAGAAFASSGSMLPETIETAPVPAHLAEHPMEKVRRLGRELAHALDEFSADAGDRWVAHIYPASVQSYPIMLENVDEVDAPWNQRHHLAFPSGKAVWS